MNFKQYLESKILDIPDEAKKLIPFIKSKIEYANKNGMSIPIEKIAELKDPFSNKNIQFFLIQRFQSQGRFEIVDGNPTIYYRIPMYDFDTIYHELVHAYDPSYRKGINKPVWSNFGQNNNTPIEQLAFQSARLNDIREKLKKMPLAERQKIISELKNWLKKSKTESELEPYNLPPFLGGLLLNNFKDKDWRQFASRLWNILQGEL